MSDTSRAERMKLATASLNQLTAGLDAAMTADVVRYLTTHETYTPEMEAFLATVPDLRKACESVVAVLARLQQVTRRGEANRV